MFEMPEIKKAPMSRYEYCSSLRKQGFQKIGNGYYAEVYARPNDNYVIKVGFVECSHTPNSFTKDIILRDWREDGYLNFLDKIKNEMDNPFFPKIHSVEFYWHPDYDEYSEHFYIVKMEKLESFEDLDCLEKAQIISKITEDSEKDSLRDIIKLVEKQKTKNKYLKKVFKILKELWKISDEDLHHGNIMLRKTDKDCMLVFTDPAS